MSNIKEIMDLESKEIKNNDNENNNDIKNNNLDEDLNEKNADDVEEINTNIVKEINEEKYEENSFIDDKDDNLLKRKRKLKKGFKIDNIIEVNFKDEEIKTNSNQNLLNKNRRKCFNLNTGIVGNQVLLYKENKKFDEENNKYIYTVYLEMNSFVNCFLENLDVKDFPFSNLVYVIKKMNNIKTFLNKENSIYVDNRYNIKFRKDNFFLYYLKLISNSVNDLNEKIKNYNNMNNKEIDEYIKILEKTYLYCYEYDSVYKKDYIEKNNNIEKGKKLFCYVDTLVNKKDIKIDIKNNPEKKDDKKDDKEKEYKDIKESFLKNIYLTKKKLFIYDELFDNYYKNYRLILTDRFEITLRALYEYTELTIRSYIDYCIGKINYELKNIIGIIKKKKNDFYLTFNWKFYFFLKDICAFNEYNNDVEELIKKLLTSYSNKFYVKYIESKFDNFMKSIVGENKNNKEIYELIKKYNYKLYGDKLIDYNKINYGNDIDKMEKIIKENRDNIINNICVCFNYEDGVSEINKKLDNLFENIKEIQKNYNIIDKLSKTEIENMTDEQFEKYLKKNVDLFKIFHSDDKVIINNLNTRNKTNNLTENSIFISDDIYKSLNNNCLINSSGVPYKDENGNVFTNVKKLLKYLKEKEINKTYDEGGNEIAYNKTTKRGRFRLKGNTFLLTYPRCEIQKKEIFINYFEDMINKIIKKSKITTEATFVLVAQEKHHLENDLKEKLFHYHCMVQFSEVKDFSDKDCFSINYNGLNVRGNYQIVYSPILCQRYCTKEDNKPFIKGELIENEKLYEKRNQIFNNLILNNDIDELVTKGYINMVNVPILDKAKKIVLDYQKKNYVEKWIKNNDIFKRDCLWIIGETTIGKTTFLTKLAKKRGSDKLDIYYKNKTKWWDDYYNQKTVIIEDLDSFKFGSSEYGASMLKVWADDKIFMGQRKGLPDTYILNENLYISSNLTPWQVLHNDGHNFIDDYTNLLLPLLRRFKIKTLVNNELHDLSPEDPYFDCMNFVDVNHPDNRFLFDYDTYRNVNETIQNKINNLILGEEIMNRTVDKYNETYVIDNNFNYKFI